MIPHPPKSHAKSPASWFQHATKVIAVVASTGAALVSIVTALYSYGVIGKGESHQSIGNLGAAWVRLRPAVDTATAIGDTIHFAATVADKRGSILVGAAPTWTTGDTTVATVTADGSVIARGAGSTTVSAVVGALVSRSRVVVQQQVARVAVTNAAGDSVVMLNEGEQLQLRTRAIDARGYLVSAREAVWQIDDTSVVRVDTQGLLTAHAAGRSLISVRVDGVSGYAAAAVATTAAELRIVAGDQQRALAGDALPQRVVVRAINRRGNPASGKLVTFRVQGTHGAVSPTTATTDADGRARTQWTLGDAPGVQSMLATIETLDSTTVVTAEAEPLAGNTRVAPLAMTLRGRAGAMLDDSVGVRLTDSTGRVLAGVPVRWSAVDGRVDALAVRTDSAGVARARWTLASVTGTQRLRAHVGASDSRIAPATFIATALSGPPARVVVLGGDRQRTAAGRALGEAIVVRVVDSSGNGAADARITLVPSAGGVVDSTLVTDSAGFARTRWTMGRSAGAHTLGIRAEGVSSVIKVRAHATAARAANLAFDDAPHASGAKRGTRQLTAFVTDAYGNPVADAPVLFTVRSGAVTPARAVTDARGRVPLRWLMGTGGSEQRLTGSVRGTDITGAYVTVAARTAGR